MPFSLVKDKRRYRPASPLASKPASQPARLARQGASGREGEKPSGLTETLLDDDLFLLLLHLKAQRLLLLVPVAVVPVEIDHCGPLSSECVWRWKALVEVEADKASGRPDF